MFLRRMASTLTTSMVEIIHDLPKRVFRAVSTEGVELGHLEYRVVDDSGRKTVDFYHTFTRTEAQGKGIAAKMVETGLNWAKDQHMIIVPSCSYVASYLKKTPKYNSSL
jgi:predicted GNAT family acetyltransferase